MQVKDEIVTLISVDLKEGTSKAGKPYRFYVATIGDDELNRLPCGFKRDEFEDGIIPDWVFKAAEEKRKIVVDLSFRPKGFDIGAELSNIREA